MRPYNNENDLWIIKESIRVSDEFGLSYVTAAKQELEKYNIRPPADLEKIIFNQLF